MTRHLGMQVSAYADRRLDARTLHAFDRHVVACEVCRYAARQESRMLASLRTGLTPGLSTDLRTTLLAMAQPSSLESRLLGIGERTGDSGVCEDSAGLEAGAHAGGPPPIPVPAAPLRHLRVPTVAPTSPALHRSPRRAAMVAGFAAGASAAAAIGLAIVGPGAGVASPLRQPASGTATTSTLTSLTSSFSASSVGLLSTRPAAAPRGIAPRKAP